MTYISDDGKAAVLLNVFKVLATPNHPRRSDAFDKRTEISVRWQKLAVQDEWFPWPSTDARPGYFRLTDCSWRAEGMLSFLGYRVGEIRGVRKEIRQLILEYAFEENLPPLGERAYRDEWGQPASTHRLRKIANSLSAFARNAKRRDRNAARAIDEWEHDLAFLHEKYYLQRFHFGWPDTLCS